MSPTRYFALQHPFNFCPSFRSEKNRCLERFRNLLKMELLIKKKTTYQVCLIPKSFLSTPHLCLVKLPRGTPTPGGIALEEALTCVHRSSNYLAVSLYFRSLLFLCPIHSIYGRTMKISQNVFPFVEILKISTPRHHLIVDGITACDYKTMRREGISLGLLIIFL